MAAKCPHCRGSKYTGRGKNRRPCAACNSAAGGAGDRIAGAAQRAVDRIVGRRLETDGQQTTEQAHRLATETTTTRTPRRGSGATPAPKKRAAAAPARKPRAAAQRAAPRLPACDRCGTRGPLSVTSRGAFCIAGCLPAGDAA